VNAATPAVVKKTLKAAVENFMVSRSLQWQTTRKKKKKSESNFEENPKRQKRRKTKKNCAAGYSISRGIY
jgi:hypothetical protein